MQLGKLFALTATAVLALLATAEAKHNKHKNRSRGWRKSVNRQCKNSGEVVLAIGGEVNKQMIRTVKRAMPHVSEITLFVNGRDFVKPANRKNRKRNRKFLESVASKVSIAALPWTTSRKLTRLNKRKLLQVYNKSAKAIEKVVGAKPTVAYVEPKYLARKVVKVLSKDFTVVGKTVRTPSSKDLDRKSFIALDSHTPKSFRKVFRTADRSLFTPVSLSKCLGKPIYDGGRDDPESVSSDNDDAPEVPADE